MFTGISDRWKMILQISLVLLFGAGVIGLIFALEKNRSYGWCPAY